MYIAESKGALRELLACSTCAIAMRVALVAREKKNYHLRLGVVTDHGPSRLFTAQ